MKHFISLFRRMAGSYMLLVLSLAACEDVKEKAELTTGTNLSDLPESGGTYQLNIEAEGSWLISMTGEGNKWCIVDPMHGTDCTEVKLVISPNTGDSRSTFLILQSGSCRDSLRVSQIAHIENLDHVVRGRLEIPRLTGEMEYQFINHTVDYQGKKVNNYCMEYHLAKRHSRWVAFTAYDVTAADHITRTDAWADDPALAPEYHTTKADYSGYDRGHLVASNDRRYYKEANEQTFYYSNMSPQLADFNQKIWQKLEENVKSWMQDAALRDTLYVVKGGTIRDDQVIKYNGDSQVAVPKYYFMAVLARKGEQYQSIAFWLEHKVYPTPYDLPGKAISVDELEENTGIDFFPLLPDAIENKVEATFDVADWTWK